MKMIKVKLEKTSRTDLICISCGGFLTDYAIAVFEPVAGIHRDCIDRIHVRRAAKVTEPVTGDGK